MKKIKTIFKSSVSEFNDDLKKINDLEKKISKLTDYELKEKTKEFQNKFQVQKKTLRSMKHEAFAVAREATKRVLGKRLYDVQILGSLILHHGGVAEMKTGEGKSITSIPAAYLNAITGKGVIITTVNEYLTERDAKESGLVYAYLGLSTGVNLNNMSPDEKRDAYRCDITYSVHSELGFDHLRDTLVHNTSEMVQRKQLYFCIIDEVDSILIDEAKTPLIISGGEEVQSSVLSDANKFVSSLTEDDYYIDDETRGVHLTEEGIQKANKYFGFKNLFLIQNSEIIHRIHNSLKSHFVLKKDVDYIVSQKQKIELVDAFTGRVLEGRSYSDGLQQSIQIKEGVKVEPETKVMATITYQNFFRLFKKLSGMTGTAKTEEKEFMHTYNMRVYTVPTNKPNIRLDHPDVVYLTKEQKYKAMVRDIKERYKYGQPILLGTEKVSESEELSELLKNEVIPHTVLNAKQNKREAEIISKAGIEKSITIATNMAGRGTDIKPTPGSLELGGLYVIGTSRADAQRIDNQLRGRSGRQGNPGESRFYLSLEDDLPKRFDESELYIKKLSKYADKDGLIHSRIANQRFTYWQNTVQGINFDARKNVLDYDDVVRQQRLLIYVQRNILISQKEPLPVIHRMMMSVIKDVIDFDIFYPKPEQLDANKITASLNGMWMKFIDNDKWFNPKSLTNKTKQERIEVLYKHLEKSYAEIRNRVVKKTGEMQACDNERAIIITFFDRYWQDHINNMSKLKNSAGFMQHAQKNPSEFYITKGNELFNEMLKWISHKIVHALMNSYLADPKYTREINVNKDKIKEELVELIKVGKVQMVSEKGEKIDLPMEFDIDSLEMVMDDNVPNSAKEMLEEGEKPDHPSDEEKSK